MKLSHVPVFFAVALVAIAVIASATSVGAFPADSQKTGQPCSACHPNPAGGGGLTAAGNTYKATGALPAAAPAPAAPAPAAPAQPAPTKAPAAPAAAPAAPAAAAPAAAAPSALPKSGEAALASSLPASLGYLGLIAAGLGLGISRLGRRRP